MRQSVVLTSALILGMLLAGCSSSEVATQPQPQPQPALQQTQASQEQTQPNNPPQPQPSQPSKQSDSFGLVSVTYSDTQINQILQLAKQEKIQMPFVPTKIIDGDEFVSAVGSLTLMYKKMILNESEQFGGGGVILQREDVQLSNGDTVQWIQVEGKASPAFWVLYLKKGNTYITIKTDGTRKKQTEMIAESLAPVKDQVQP